MEYKCLPQWITDAKNQIEALQAYQEDHQHPFQIIFYQILTFTFLKHYYELSFIISKSSIIDNCRPVLNSPAKKRVKEKTQCRYFLYSYYFFFKSYHTWSLIFSQQTDYRSRLKNSCRMFYIDVHRNLLGREYNIPLSKIQSILFPYKITSSLRNIIGKGTAFS